MKATNFVYDTNKQWKKLKINFCVLNKLLNINISTATKENGKNLNEIQLMKKKQEEKRHNDVLNLGLRSFSYG